MESANLRDRDARERAVAHVLDLYRSGLTIREAAERTGVRYGFAYKAIAEAGIQRPAGEGTTKRFLKIREVHHAKVRDMRGAGASLAAISKAIGISPAIVKQCLLDMGIDPTQPSIVRAAKGEASKRAHLKARERYHNDVRRLFEAGYPILTISNELGIGRAMVATCLNDIGIQPPTIAEGNRRSASLATAEARQSRASAAHEAIRRSGLGPISRAQQSAKKQASGFYIGFGETDVAEQLEARGIRCTTQRAWNGYNIDIMAGHLAVEIHVATGRPALTTQSLCRAIDMLSSGISVIYLWFPRATKNGRQLSTVAIDEVVAFHDLTGRDPSPLGQYRVVRSDGKIDFSSSRYLDKITDVVARYSALKAKG